MSSFPSFLRGFWKAWLAFSHVLGVVISTVILTILWIVGFGLYAIVLNILTFPKRFRKPPETYWIPARSTPAEELRYPF